MGSRKYEMTLRGKSGWNFVCFSSLWIYCENGYYLEMLKVPMYNLYLRNLYVTTTIQSACNVSSCFFFSEDQELANISINYKLCEWNYMHSIRLLTHTISYFPLCLFPLVWLSECLEDTWKNAFC